MPKVIVNSTPLIALCHVDALDVSKDFIFNGNLI